MQTVDQMPKGQRLDSVGSAVPRNAPKAEPPTSMGKLIYHTIRDRVVDQPLLFYSIWRGRENNVYEKRVTRPDSTIVIEGFPRCGNTFAFYAFLLAQVERLDGGTNHVNVGNHMHCVGQFALARRWKIPAILVVRNPHDTIVSNFIYESELPLGYYVRRYINFHASMRTYLDSIVVSDFPETTRGFGRVIGKVNAKFGTHFLAAPDTQQAQDRVLAEVERQHNWRRTVSPNTVKSNRASFPSADKNSRKAMVEDLLDNRKYYDLLQRAEEAYRALT